MTYRVMALLALLALAVGMVLLAGPQHESAAPSIAGAPAHDPGYSAQQARLVQTGTDGLPVYTLDAAHIQQQPNDGKVELQQVRLGFRDPNGNEWTARALHGELEPGTGIVRLSDDVHVYGLLPGTNDPAQISSQHLAYDTRTQIVSTRDPVTVLMSGRELEATGLVANLKERRLQLESAVHGTFRQ
ncbi:MAG: LPS export ABC transporter periplasmic protein LptC [Gammaproteobacteria bacterium]|nr:LPS export ABC transporter periplasmic protein LptC [Gammaproteobacteria bacterium]